MSGSSKGVPEEMIDIVLSLLIVAGLVWMITVQWTTR